LHKIRGVRLREVKEIALQPLLADKDAIAPQLRLEVSKLSKTVFIAWGNEYKKIASNSAIDVSISLFD
jgi:hypothetical protein